MQTKLNYVHNKAKNSRRLVWTIEKIHTQPIGSLQQANNISRVSQIDFLTRLCVEHQKKGLNSQVNDPSFDRNGLVFQLKNQRIATCLRVLPHYLFPSNSAGLRLSKSTLPNSTIPVLLGHFSVSFGFLRYVLN